MLHLIYLSNLGEEIIQRIGSGDDVVLQAGLVWTARQKHTDHHQLLQLLAKQCQVFILQEMLIANGIEVREILAGIKVIDYPELVRLTEKNPVIMTWN